MASALESPAAAALEASPGRLGASRRLLLKGSWDLVTRVIVRVTILITPIKVLITLLTKSHDPTSRMGYYRGFL